MTGTTARFDDFWSRQEAFQAKVASSGERHTGGNRFGGAAFARKIQLWQGYGRRYDRNPSAVTMRGFIIISPAEQARFWREIVEKMDEVGAAATGAFDRWLGQQAIDAFEEWPVATGASKASIGVRFEIVEGMFKGSLYVDAPYARFISGAEDIRAKAKAKAAGVTVATWRKIRGKKRALPAWKMRLIHKGVFDVAAYEQIRAEAASQGYASIDDFMADRYAGVETKRENGLVAKPAKGHPGVDLITKPAKATLAAISADVVKVANEGKL
jgi:hypothetical protein